MKCLIFSDSHGRCDYIKKALRLHPDAEVVFFLGDGVGDLEEIKAQYPQKAFLAVYGNCDYYRILGSAPLDAVGEIQLLGKRIVYTHGHLFDVKFSLVALSQLAKARCADIVLFGHTHKACEQYIAEPHPHYLFNPGSIGQQNHSYGIMILKDGWPLFSVGEIE